MKRSNRQKAIDEHEKIKIADDRQNIQLNSVDSIAFDIQIHSNEANEIKLFSFSIWISVNFRFDSIF